MTIKFQEVGEVKSWTNTGSAVAKDAIVAMGCVVGVAVTDIAAGAEGAVKIIGVLKDVPKTTGTAWTLMLPLNWDVSTSKFDSAAATPATGDVVKCAIAWEAAGSADTTGVVYITPNPSAVVT